VSGPPGAGKSTASRLVAERLSPSVCIESDQYWSTIVNGFIQPWLPESAEQTRAVASAYSAAAARMALGGYFVVLEGVVGPWLLPIVESEMKSSGVELIYVVLRPTRETAIARGMSRRGQEAVPGLPALADPGPIGDLWDLFAEIGEYETNVLDTTRLDPVAVASLIWDRFAQR
jgi:hypothetical protein